MQAISPQTVAFSSSKSATFQWPVTTFPFINGIANNNVPHGSSEYCLACLNYQPSVTKIDDKIASEPLCHGHWAVVQLQFCKGESSGHCAGHHTLQSDMCKAWDYLGADLLRLHLTDVNILATWRSTRWHFTSDRALILPVFDTQMICIWKQDFLLIYH